MSASSATLAGRQRAEQLMVDTCRIERATGTTTDPDTGKVSPAVETIYDGPCRVQSALVARSEDAGDFDYPLQRPVLSIPMAVTGVRTGDVATVSSSQLDPDLVGVRLRVTVPVHKTHATARRLPCTEGGTDA